MDQKVDNGDEKVSKESKSELSALIVTAILIFLSEKRQEKRL